MAYIGKTPDGVGVRSRFYFTQGSSGATSLSGNDDAGKTLTFSDGAYVDVLLNGVGLVAGTDYNTTTANTIAGLAALASGDVVEVVVYDIFTVADTVSAGSGGTFAGAVTVPQLNADNIRIDGNTISSIDANGNLTLDPNGTGDTIIASGNVGIGTSSPSTVLHIDNGGSNGSGQADAVRLHNPGTSAGDGAGIKFSSGTSTTGAGIFGIGQALNSANLVFRAGGDTERMRIDSSGHVQIQSNASTGNLVFKESTTDSWSIRNNGANGYLAFFDDYNNAERMRIGNSGKLCVNRTSGGGTANIKSQSNSFAIEFYHHSNDASVGYIGTTTSSTSYNTSSDYRLKEAVVNMTGAIDRVKALAPKRFNFIADDSVTVDGFLAHEAQAVVPEAITGTHNEVDENGDAVMQGIDQSKLVPLLTGALQEAIAKIETLETKVAALEAGS